MALGVVGHVCMDEILVMMMFLNQIFFGEKMAHLVSVCLTFYHRSGDICAVTEFGKSFVSVFSSE